MIALATAPMPASASTAGAGSRRSNTTAGRVSKLHAVVRVDLVAVQAVPILRLRDQYRPRV